MRQQLYDHFIPHEGNDYAPHILQRFAIVAMLILVLLSFTAANIQTLIWMTSDWMVSTILPSVIVDLTNEERTDLAVGPLVRSSTLDAAAKQKAEHMAKNQYFAHYSPDGVSPWYWFDQVGYNYLHAGENLAIHFSDSGEVIEAWMNSPSHRANIANGNYQEIGVGTARGTYEGFDTIYVVQLFGTKMAGSAVPAPTEQIIVAQSTQTEEPQPVLAESIAIESVPNETETVTEDVTEPIVITAVNDPDTEPAPLFAEEIIEEATITDPAPTEIAEVEVNEEMISVYSGTVSTSTVGVPATMQSATSGSTKQSSMLGELATRPNIVLQIVYIMMGIFVAIALVMSIVIEVRHQRPVQIAYGIGLLMIMTGLFYIHSYITAGALVV